MILASVIGRVFLAALPVRLGSVAAIVDKEGGVRVSVTTDDRTFEAQLDAGRDERAYVVPDYFEPMYCTGDGCRDGDGHDRPHWTRSAYIVNRATAHLEKTLGNPCGSCRACCIVVELTDGDEYKPPYTPCRHLCGTGCGFYNKRPSVCRTFDCLWLESQRGNDPMRSELRPDRCGAFLTRNSLADLSEERIEIHRFKADWDKNVYLAEFLDGQRAMGRKPEVVTHYVGGRSKPVTA